MTLQASYIGEPQLLGHFDVDLNCPLDMAREFLRRAFWKELNERVGSAFDYVQQGTAVLEQEEATMKLRDVTPQRLNSLSRELEYSLTLCASMTREKTVLDSQTPATKSKGDLFHNSTQVGTKRIAALS